MMVARVIAAAVVALLLSIGGALAAPCPTYPAGYITAPCFIAANGDYVLGADLTVTSMPSWSTYGQFETPIVEVGPGVTQALINCNGHRITHNGTAYSAQGIGVGGKLNANIRVLGCTFLGTGLMMCTMFDNAANWAYQNIRVDYNYCTATWQGFFTQSHGAHIVDNIVDNIGGHSVCLGGSYTYAIQLYGGYSTAGPAEIKRNRIRRVWNACGNEVVGISMSGHGQQVEIEDNVVENDRIVNTKSIAMWFGWLSGPMVYRGNKVDNWHNGYLAGYAPVYGPATLDGTALMTNIEVPMFGFDEPPVGIWSISP